MTIKRLLKKYLPRQDSLLKESHHPFVRKYLLQPQFWHLNRRCLAKGTAVGLLIAFLPLPLQMLVAILLATLVGGNIPIAVMMTWVTNPFTFVPINLFIFKVGEWVLHEDAAAPLIQEFNWNDLKWSTLPSTFAHWLVSLGKPFLAGLPIVAVVTSLLGFITVHVFWRCSTRIRWILRKRKGGN